MKPYYVVQHKHDIYGWLDVTSPNNHYTKERAKADMIRDETYMPDAKFRIIKRTDEVVRTKKERKEEMKYDYSIIKNEISGFGGEYEEACRKMVVAGIQWCDEHPDADLRFKTYKNIYGITTDESPDVKELQMAMRKTLEDDGPTGAMMQCALSHVMYIKINGWDKYVEEMNKEEEK